MRKWMYAPLAGVLTLALFMTSCVDKTDDPDDPTDTPANLGWFGDDDMNTVQTNVTQFGSGNNLPSSVDLVPKFPPIGDQGQYGTCVAWAVAYNHKTAINGMDKGYNASQLNSPAYQFSPKDLFIAIPDNEKGPNCNGTDFVSALSVLQNRGVATMATVPYNGLSDCGSYNGQQSWANEAGNHKIQYWRKVEAGNATDLKTLLADNIPIIFGARLADNFMSWNSDAVLSSSSSFQNVGQHAYHAMVIAGYDDNKGAGAFKVINSWGKGWGAQGYIWIDYNFFMNEFCRNSTGDRPLFIAVNKGGDITPPDDPDPTATGVDLAAWVFDDYADGFYNGFPKRVSNFNVYNIGNQSANASSRWSVYYLVFDAFDANNYGVLFNCDFNTDIAANTYNCPTFNSCTFNLNIPSGSDLVEQAGWQEFTFEYTMPNITGYYYLVIYVDPFEAFAETDETNNLFYPYYDPIYFTNGQGFMSSDDDSRSSDLNQFSFKNDLQPTPANLKRNDHFSLTKNAPNAYRSEEIAAVIRASKQDGRWAKKMAEMRERYSDR